MAQILSGLRLGNGFSLLFGSYDPNSPPPGADAATGAVDWMYIRLGGNSASTWLYRCDTSAVFSNGQLVTAAHWTAK